MQGDVYTGTDTVEYLASGVPDRVFFATNETVLTTASRETLRKQAGWLRKNSKINVVLDSSNLKEATYHTDSKTLLVEFKNGVEYEYSDVPWEIFTKFRMADSQGSFFNKNIGRVFEYKKIEEDEN